MKAISDLIWNENFSTEVSQDITAIKGESVVTPFSQDVAEICSFCSGGGCGCACGPDFGKN